MDNPVRRAALRRSLSRSEGTANGYVLLFMEETYIAAGKIARGLSGRKVYLDCPKRHYVVP
jgi:hypothetical protein